MNRLFELGITENDIKFMLDSGFEIFDMSEEEIGNKIDILKYIGCDLKQIKHIIVSNPEYLGRSNKDILKLIEYLRNIGIKDVNLLVESNPYFLNLDDFEIKDYVSNRISMGIDMDDIVNEIENNPYIIGE